MLRLTRGRPRSLLVAAITLAVTSCTSSTLAVPTRTPEPSPSASPSPSPSASPSPSSPPANCVDTLSDFKVRYERGTGVFTSTERAAKRGTQLALKAYDTKVPDCDDWRVAVDLVPKSNKHLVASTHPEPPDFTITVYATGIWFGESGSDKLITMLHEWYHVEEYALFACPSCKTSRPPKWLIEGAAVYESYRAADSLHIATYSSQRAIELYRGRKTHTPLKSLEGSVKTGGGYSISFLATELLVGNGGSHALLSFWNQLGDTGDVEGSFKEAFGVSLPAFYQRFQAYRNRGFVGS